MGNPRNFASVLAAAALTASLAAGTAPAADMTITVWAGGSNANDAYRVDAIEMAADILAREAEIRGESINVTVDKKLYDGWDDFKQAVTLAAESGNAPHIVVTGHEDIAPWANAGIIRKIEDLIDMDAWPVNDIFPNLIEISSYEGAVYGLPQDAESRPFFVWIPHMKAIGYSDADIAALPERVAGGEYTLYDVLDDAKKMQDQGVVAPGYGFYPRVSNGPDYWQFYQSFRRRDAGCRLGQADLRPGRDDAVLQVLRRCGGDGGHPQEPCRHAVGSVVRGGRIRQGGPVARRHLALRALHREGGPDRLLRQDPVRPDPRGRRQRAAEHDHPSAGLPGDQPGARTTMRSSPPSS